MNWEDECYLLSKKKFRENANIINVFSPSKGKITINNQDTRNLSFNQKDELRRKNISMIFQDNNLLTDFSALENIMMPLIIKGEKEKIISIKTEKILKFGRKSEIFRSHFGHFLGVLEFTPITAGSV